MRFRMINIQILFVCLWLVCLKCIRNKINVGLSRVLFSTNCLNCRYIEAIRRRKRSNESFSLASGDKCPKKGDIKNWTSCMKKMAKRVHKICRSCLDDGSDINWYPLCGKIINVDTQLVEMIQYCTKSEVKTKNVLYYLSTSNWFFRLV